MFQIGFYVQSRFAPWWLMYNSGGVTPASNDYQFQNEIEFQFQNGEQYEFQFDTIP